MVDVLHINDNKLLLRKEREQFASQGYAWLANESVHFDLGGDAQSSAIKRCRLAPQEINNRYWMQCDQSAISSNIAGMRHAADLIWQHLSQLKQQFNLDDLVLVVPSHYRSENLQLLLGVAKACDLRIRGLLNKASLALASGALSSDQANEGDYLHHDVQLHQTVSSRLTVADGSVTLGEVEIIQDVGIHLMQETLLKGLQHSFIQNDRFDPLHDASTEQQLFDQLPKIAEQIAAHGKANIGVEHQSKLHSTSLDTKEWQALLSGFTQRLAQASAGKTLIDLNSAFGSASLAGLDAAGIELVQGAPERDIDALISDAGDGRSVVYQTDVSLPSADRKTSHQPTPGAKPNASKEASVLGVASHAATHLLSAGKAIAISEAEVSMHDNSLSVKVGGAANVNNLLTGGQLFVMNDEGRTMLKPNDRLGSHLADGVITVIQVI